MQMFNQFRPNNEGSSTWATTSPTSTAKSGRNVALYRASTSVSKNTDTRDTGYAKLRIRIGIRKIFGLQFLTRVYKKNSSEIFNIFLHYFSKFFEHFFCNFFSKH